MTPDSKRGAVNRIIGIMATVVFAALLGWSTWTSLTFLEEYDAIVGAVESWRRRPPPGVANSDWYHACETVRSLIGNTVRPFYVSRADARRLRLEIQQRDNEPMSARTLEWLVLRLMEIGPREAEFIQRMRMLWEPPLIRVRAAEGGPELEAVYGQLGEWRERCPPNESSLAWYLAIHALQTAVVRIYDQPHEDTTDELVRLREHIETMSAQPITPDTLRGLARQLGDSSRRGAEYMQEMECLKEDFDFLDRARRSPQINGYHEEHCGMVDA